MFDSQTTSISIEIALISILFYTFASVYTLFVYKRWPVISNNKVRDFFWLLFFVLYAVTYAIDSDFFHYKEIVYSTTEVLDYGLEQVYQYLILFINNNYLLFRIIVFGGAALVYYFTLTKYRINRTAGILLMLIVFGGVFCYARATLAYAVYYLGVSFIISKEENRKSFSYNVFGKSIWFALGLALILSSFFFHRSMLILIALTPFSFLKLGKRSIFIIILLSPIVLYAFRSILGDVFSILAFDDNIERRVTDVYVGASNSNVNWKGVIGYVLNYGVYALCFILISVSLFKNNTLINNWVKRLYTFYFTLSYVALLCYPLFDGNIIYMHRFLKMTSVPIIIILSYLYTKKYLPFRSLKLILFWAIMGSYWSFAQFIF